MVILKNGVDASEQVKEEAAQFSASFSKAWENAQSSVDVYCLKKEQVTKSRNMGSLSKGSFMLKGEREWYRGTPLGLSAFMEEIGEEGKKRKVVTVAPERACRNRLIHEFLIIGLGNTRKSDAAKKIAQKLKYDNVDYIMQHLPAGPFSVK